MMNRRKLLALLSAALVLPTKVLAKFESREVIFTASERIGHVCIYFDDNIVTLCGGETITIKAGKDFTCEF